MNSFAWPRGTFPWPASMEGINFHISSYFYTKEDGWSCSHPEQLSACALRKDASEPLRWTCWACARQVNGRLSPLNFFKTSAEHLEHFFMCDAADHHWDFARKGAELGVSANDFCIAIVGKDLKTTALPTGQPLSIVPLLSPLTSDWPFEIGDQGPLEQTHCSLVV